MIGLFDYYPALKKSIEIHLVDFQRPRPALVQMLGTENQSCPVLILGGEPHALPSTLKIHQANGHYFVEGADEIATYLAHTYAIGLPY